MRWTGDIPGGSDVNCPFSFPPLSQPLYLFHRTTNLLLCFSMSIMGVHRWDLIVLPNTPCPPAEQPKIPWIPRCHSRLPRQLIQAQILPKSVKSCTDEGYPKLSRYGIPLSLKISLPFRPATLCVLTEISSWKLLLFGINSPGSEHGYCIEN